jgi:hypothetical protein
LFGCPASIADPQAITDAMPHYIKCTILKAVISQVLPLPRLSMNDAVAFMDANQECRWLGVWPTDWRRLAVIAIVLRVAASATGQFDAIELSTAAARATEPPQLAAAARARAPP